ncbi:MAG: hypothetical protein JF593_07515 [Novosphingobium sp.]|nr:hypothetical protein [Novosphingobium sp.]
MPRYRLIFTSVRGETVPETIDFTAPDPGQALQFAQWHSGPTEVWTEDRKLFTLSRSGNNDEVWIISGNQGRTRQESRPTEREFSDRVLAGETTPEGLPVAAAPEAMRQWKE